MNGAAAGGGRGGASESPRDRRYVGPSGVVAGDLWGASGGSPGDRPPLPPGPYLVVGLARSGVAAARALVARGAQVIGVDSGAPVSGSELARAGVRVELESDGMAALADAAAVIKSPGVPPHAPVVRAARERGLPVLGEFELGWRLLPNRFLAVTGTNGKTTTVELLGAIFRAAGRPARMAGNVGTPLCALAPGGGGEPVDPDDLIVCEASSFQLADASEFAPDCAVLLNLDEDHLDWHGDLDSYHAAKLRVFARQGPGAIAVTGPAVALDPPGAARRVRCGVGAGAGDLWRDDTRLMWGTAPLMELSAIRTRGRHNVDNAMAAAAAGLSVGVDLTVVAAALAGFGGLRHRLEDVADCNGVTFVNDSKATNVDAARVAIESFTEPVHVILGGSAKGGSFAGLAEPISRLCAACYLIGESADTIHDDLTRAGVPAAGVRIERCGDLDTAVRAAAAAATLDQTVLLAPACASFDQFRDYEERGERFIELVGELCAEAAPSN